MWAAPLVLDTPYRSFYVKGEFNTTRAVLDQLGITHVITVHDREVTNRVLLQRLPEASANREYLVTLPMFDKRPKLYAWPSHTRTVK
jgi:hypothetical protein